MKSKFFLTGICILLLSGIAGCGTAPGGDNPDANGTDELVVYEYTEEGIIKPEIAEKVIGGKTDQAINAIKEKDAETISALAHPVKGIRFTPYTFVLLERDVVFSKEALPGFFEDEEKYLWGYYDGIGDEIILTPAAYYEEFIYTADFVNADEIGYNTVLSSGNMLENQFEIYENPIVVEYYFPVFDQEFIGMDWQSLRLVFEEYEKQWFLTGIIHNRWTI
jgi:hypothetical protein